MSYTEPAASVSVAHGAGVPGAAQVADGNLLLERILNTLSEDKAEDIVSIDLRGRSAMADHMVVASGRSSRQVTALAERLTDRLKQENGILCKVEGKDQGDWVLIDTGDVIVHIFRPEVREFYQIEKLWQPVGAYSA